MPHGRGKSDNFVVPGKSPNNAGQVAAAEAMEGRELAKGNAVEADARRKQGRERATSALERVRQADGVVCVVKQACFLPGGCTPP